MRNLLYLIFRYSAFLVFILLEVVAFYLIISYNKSQGEIWAHSGNLLTGSINKRIQGVEDFVTLRDLNDSLFRENAKLLETILNYRISEDNKFQNFEASITDTSLQYQLIPANVCDKSINLRNNFMTLCAGSEDGITPLMGIISKDGVIGLVKRVSKKFSTVQLLINSQSRISAMINNKGYHGNLIWASEDIREMKLLDVPKHSNISIGDTVVTSGFSISFPKYVPIGKIKDFSIVGGSNNFDITVQLDYDLSQVTTVYAVNFIDSEEKKETIEAQDE